MDEVIEFDNSNVYPLEHPLGRFPSLRKQKKLDWETCLCWDLGYQICHHYENWCSEIEGQEWWDSLSEDEKRAFEPVSPPPENREDETDWPF